MKKLITANGKGGCSYLADDGSEKYVLKQIHHEPCADFVIRAINVQGGVYMFGKMLLHMDFIGKLVEISVL